MLNVDNVIEVKNITKHFGNFTAVKNISFELEGGKIYGLIGPNGAGKSTTMSLLMGLIFPSEGSGFVKGHVLGDEKAKQIMGYSPEFPSFYTDMSCLEYLVYMGTLAGLEYDAAVDKTINLSKEFGLEEHLLKKVNKFSTGMKKKVGLIQAMINDPEILLLDEPTANLDPTSRSEIISGLKQLVEKTKMTVIISSHVLTELETIVDHVLMINKGTLVLNQSINELKETFNQEVVLFSCSNNQLAMEYLNKHNLEFTVEKKYIRIVTKDKTVCKNLLVRFVFENSLVLDYLQEEIISLENLYIKIVEESKNETHID